MSELLYQQIDGKLRTLTDEDVEAIAEAVIRRQTHLCRFQVSEDELEAAVRFHQNVNQLMSETGSTIRKTLIVSGVGGLVALLILGVYAKLKQELGIQ